MFKYGLIHKTKLVIPAAHRNDTPWGGLPPSAHPALGHALTEGGSGSPERAGLPRSKSMDGGASPSTTPVKAQAKTPASGIDYLAWVSSHKLLASTGAAALWQCVWPHVCAGLTPCGAGEHRDWRRSCVVPEAPAASTPHLAVCGLPHVHSCQAGKAAKVCCTVGGRAVELHSPAAHRA